MDHLITQVCESFLLQVSLVSKQYNKKQILRDVSFELQRGTSYVLMGHNGCGKSTLLRIMAGLTVADAGKVQYGSEIIKIAFMLVISIVVTIITTGFPVILNLLNGKMLFTRALTTNDVVNAFLFMTGASVCGASVGSFFHPVYVKDKRWGTLLTWGVCVLVVAKAGIVEKYTISCLVMWMVPSATLVSEYYGNTDFFQIGATLIILAVYSVYSVVLFGIRIYICNRVKF